MTIIVNLSVLLAIVLVCLFIGFIAGFVFAVKERNKCLHSVNKDSDKDED